MRELEYVAKFNASIEENLKAYGISSRICILLKRELGLVTLNAAPQFVVAHANKGDIIRIAVPDPEPHQIAKYNCPIEFLYEDEDLAVINKPANLACISTTAHYNRSLMNALACLWGDFVYHPVNRLDKGTSGLMLVARNALSHSILSCRQAAYSNGDKGASKPIEREYLCLAVGNIAEAGIIDAPIAQLDKTTYRRIVDYDKGKRAVTEYSVVASHGKLNLIKLRLHTGRTHQIRVHMAHIGIPLVGDALYGGDITQISRPCLHSSLISFKHPITEESMQFQTNMPEDMRKIWESKW